MLFSPTPPADALDALSLIQAQAEVEPLFAIHAGSKAWNFQGPDSDSDLRFIFLRPPASFLGRSFPRDVIDHEDFPVGSLGAFDASGWEARKLLQQGAEGHAAVWEWIDSPSPALNLLDFQARVIDLLEPLSDLRSALFYHSSNASHYLDHFGPRSRRPVPKKMLYALRHALSAEWISLHASARAPHDIDLLLPLLPAGSIALDEARELLRLKRSGSDLSTFSAPALLDQLSGMASSCKQRAQGLAKTMPPSPQALAALDEFLLELYRETFGFESRRSAAPKPRSLPRP